MNPLFTYVFNHLCLHSLVQRVEKYINSIIRIGKTAYHLQPDKEYSCHWECLVTALMIIADGFEEAANLIEGAAAAPGRDDQVMIKNLTGMFRSRRWDKTGPLLIETEKEGGPSGHLPQPLLSRLWSDGMKEEATRLMGTLWTPKGDKPASIWMYKVVSQ